MTNDPTKAHYRLQANVLSIEEMTPEEANHILSAGYGAVLGAVPLRWSRMIVLQH